MSSRQLGWLEGHEWRGLGLAARGINHRRPVFCSTFDAPHRRRNDGVGVNAQALQARAGAGQELRRQAADAKGIAHTKFLDEEQPLDPRPAAGQGDAACEDGSSRTPGARRHGEGRAIDTALRRKPGNHFMQHRVLQAPRVFQAGLFPLEFGV